MNINSATSKLLLVAKVSTPKAIKSLSKLEKNILKMACDSFRKNSSVNFMNDHNNEVNQLTYKLASRNIVVIKDRSSIILRIIRSIFYCFSKHNRLISKIDTTIQNHLYGVGYGAYKNIVQQLINQFDKDNANQQETEHFKHTLNTIESFYLRTVENAFRATILAADLVIRYTDAADKNDFFARAFNIADLTIRAQHQRILNYPNGGQHDGANDPVIEIVNPDAEDSDINELDNDLENYRVLKNRVDVIDPNLLEKVQENDILYVPDQEYFWDLAMLFRDQQTKKYARDKNMTLRNEELIFASADFKNNYINIKSFEDFLKSQAVIGKVMLVENEVAIIDQDMMDIQIAFCVESGLIQPNARPAARPQNFYAPQPATVTATELPKPADDNPEALASWEIYKRMLQSLTTLNIQSQARETITRLYTIGVLHKEEILRKVQNREYKGCFSERRSGMVIHLEGGSFINGRYVNNTPEQEYQLAKFLLTEAPALRVRLFLYQEAEDKLADFFTRAFPRNLCLDRRYEALIEYAN